MLTIDRLRLDCRTARDHPAPSEVPLRLRRIVERDLPHHLSAQLNRAPADRRIVLIRQLHVQLHLDAALDEIVLAKAFASAIAAGIQAAEPDDDVVIYADEIEQTTRLLIDLASGTASKRWQHRRAFPGLMHLPPTAAIRTIALDSPRQFLDATARMTMGSLQTLTAALNAADSERITASPSIAGQLTQADPAEVETAVAKLWDEYPAARGDTLLLFLATRRTVSSASLAQISDAVRAARDGQEGECTRRPTPPAAVGDGVTWTTPFGALFLLLPYLVEAGPVAAEAAQRHGIARALAGPGVDDDAAIAALLGLAESRSAPNSVEPLEDPTVDWLFGVNAIGPVLPVVRTARLAGRRVRIVVDAPTGHWLAIASGVGTAAAMRRVTDQFPPVDIYPRGRLAPELRRLGALGRATLGDCLTATNLIRRMANSLPGFATAGSAHIWREALDTGADVTVGDGGWHVRLNRSPLAEILRICGHGDRTTAVPWLGSLPVRVVMP